MYEQSKLSELIQFARVDAGSTVIDVYPGDGDWTRLFSDVVGPEGRVYSFVPAQVANFKNDPVAACGCLRRNRAILRPIVDRVTNMTELAKRAIKLHDILVLRSV